MEIEFSETKYKKANITDLESIRVAIATIRKEFDIPERAYIDGNKLMKTVEYHTSHSWDTDEEHRDLHADDPTAMRAIEMLYEAANAHRDAGNYS